MTAEIHNFPPERVTRPLVFDAIFANDGNYLKESSADNSWRERCMGINNLFVQAHGAWAKRVDAESAPGSAGEFIETTLLALHLAVADVIEGSGEEEPSCDDSARLFALSIKREHRQAARVYKGSSHACTRDLVRGSDLEGLQIFWNMTEILWPGLGKLQREALRLAGGNAIEGTAGNHERPARSERANKAKPKGKPA